MAKNKKILTILIVAIVVAIAGGISLYLYLSPQKTTVYVFKDNYESGTALSEDMLVPVRCDSKIVTAGKNADVKSKFVTGSEITEVLNAGDHLRMDVSEGMPLTKSELFINGGSDIEKNIHTGMIAVTIPMDSVTGTAEGIREGSHVNIYATGYQGTDGTTLLFQNVSVIAVEKNNAGVLTSATVEVNTDQSLKLIYAQNNSTLNLAVVDSAGYEYTEQDEPTYTGTAKAN